MVVLAGAVVGYVYAGYPALLWLAARFRPAPSRPTPPLEWPRISLTLAAYNEEAAIGATLDCLLATDYPPERRQIVVVSDASTDGTDPIVRTYEDRGVELLRLPTRSGKTAAENAARSRLSGDIILNTDASVRVHRAAVKALVTALQDPRVGVASSRDVSVARKGRKGVGEARYVGYEMWVRQLETRVFGIVGASGSLYATRSVLHNELVPEALSRDFSAALIAREHGLRTVSVDDALCYVPQGRSLRREYRRKVRTMTRGLQTMYFRRHLLNPIRYGVFSWMLLSHKLARWVVPWVILAGLAGCIVAAPAATWARAILVVAAVGTLLAAVGWAWPTQELVPRVVGVPAYFVGGVFAGLHAWTNALKGEINPVWEPTRRESLNK